MSQPDPNRMNGPVTTLPPAAVYPQPRPPMIPFPPPPPQQHHIHTLTNPLRHGFLLGLGFMAAALVPIAGVVAGLVVLIITLAGIGSAASS